MVKAKVLGEPCNTCKNIKRPKYKLITSNTYFCSLECIKLKFNNYESINYESFRCNY